MNENIIEYLNKYSIPISEINNFNLNDKFLIFNNQLYIKTSQKEFCENYEIDKFIAIKIRNFDPNKQRDDILKDTNTPNPYNENFVYYKSIPDNNEIITFLIEQSKIYEKITQIQIDKISSINAKLTFFVILTIISIIVSVIMALK